MRTHIMPLGLFVSFCASIAQAGLLDPVSISRYVDATGIKQTATGTEPFSGMVNLPDGRASAMQQSTITADTIAISGSASSSGDVDSYAWAASRLREEFVLTDRSPYRFSAEWNMNDDAAEDLGFYLSGPSGDLFRGFRSGSGTWTSRGYLDPGQYAFGVAGSVGAGKDHWSSPSMSFSATFSLTPEPATLALAALGALALVRRRRAAAQH